MRDKFTAAYIDAALWAGTDGNEPLDRNYDAGDIDADSLRIIENDCRRFQDENADDITDSEAAGHDFYLTRNGHGCGFWDGDWPEDVGARLTAASHRFGESELIPGDDGVLYVMPS